MKTIGATTEPPSLPASVHGAATDLLAIIAKAEGDAAYIDAEPRKFASSYPTPAAASAALAAVLLVAHATNLDVAPDREQMNRRRAKRVVRFP